jgi:hypothetical protein
MPAGTIHFATARGAFMRQLMRVEFIVEHYHGSIAVRGRQQVAKDAIGC